MRRTTQMEWARHERVNETVRHHYLISHLPSERYQEIVKSETKTKRDETRA